MLPRQTTLKHVRFLHSINKVHILATTSDGFTTLFKEVDPAFLKEMEKSGKRQGASVEHRIFTLQKHIDESVSHYIM
ncbi:hypothetical protein ACFL13_00245 [Patescibacteria group bacterium]